MEDGALCAPVELTQRARLIASPHPRLSVSLEMGIEWLAES